jgi:hypothetical protein
MCELAFRVWIGYNWLINFLDTVTNLPVSIKFEELIESLSDCQLVSHAVSVCV